MIQYFEQWGGENGKTGFFAAFLNDHNLLFIKCVAKAILH